MSWSEDRVYTFSERAGCSSTARAAWPLRSLRTDSVNRACCISFFTLEMIFLASSSRLLFFVLIQRICHAPCTKSVLNGSHIRGELLEMPVKQGSGIRKSGKVFGQGQKTPKMVRAGLYARVSTQDQQTLPMQTEPCASMPRGAAGPSPCR